MREQTYRWCQVVGVGAVAVALLMVAGTGDAVAQSARRATFELRNEVTIKVPDASGKVRAWVALPQDDPYQVVSDLKMEAPYPYRIDRDSEGSNRDLTMSPKQDGEPVNALPKAYVEVDGKTHPEGMGWVRRLTFQER